MQYILWEGKFELNKNQPTSFNLIYNDECNHLNVWQYDRHIIHLLYLQTYFNFACMEFKYIRCIFDINHAGNQSNGNIWNKHIFT